jgi:hypothetical protein
LHSYPSKALLCGSFGSQMGFSASQPQPWCSEMTQTVGWRRIWAVIRATYFKFLIGSVYEDGDSADGSCSWAFGGAGGGGSGACRVYRTMQRWNLYECRRQTGGLPRTSGREGVVCGGGSSSGKDSDSACPRYCTRSYGSAKFFISEGGNSLSGSCGGSFP